MNQVAIIIPARYGSTRFAGKPLVRICGRPMIQLVYEKATMVKGADFVIVATDDERILEAVKGFHGNAVMTSPLHQTGSDRILAGDEGRPAGRATLLCVIVGKDHAFSGNAVNIGRLVAHHPAVIVAQVPVPDIIAHDDEDVGLIRGLNGQSRNTQAQRRHRCHIHRSQ